MIFKYHLKQWFPSWGGPTTCPRTTIPISPGHRPCWLGTVVHEHWRLPPSLGSAKPQLKGVADWSQCYIYIGLSCKLDKRRIRRRQTRLEFPRGQVWCSSPRPPDRCEFFQSGLQLVYPFRDTSRVCKTKARMQGSDGKSGCATLA